MNNVNFLRTRTDLINLIPDNSIILEIGVFKGEFSKEIIKLKKFKELYLVDIWLGAYGSGDKDGNNHTIIENMESVYMSLYKQTINRPDIHILRIDSNNFLKNWDDNYFDVIYIDGDHTEEVVYDDLVLSFGKIKDGGLLMGHDYASCSGVTNAVNRFCENYNQKIDTIALDVCQSFLIKIKK